MLIKDSQLIKVIEKHDPNMIKVLNDADAQIQIGFPNLQDHRIPWINKSSQILEDLTQYKTNYQYIYDNTYVISKELEYQALNNEEYTENSGFTSWNEKSLQLYKDTKLKSVYNQLNYYRAVINLVSELINILKSMSR